MQMPDGSCPVCWSLNLPVLSLRCWGSLITQPDLERLGPELLGYKRPSIHLGSLSPPCLYLQPLSTQHYSLHTTNATDYHTSSFHYIKLFRFSGICVSAVQHCLSTFMTVKPLNILTRDGGVSVYIGVKAQDVLKETISSR